MKLAIIGGGPRALFAVEELVSATEKLNGQARIDVTVFEPETPGAGWVYRQDQPACWRLNAPAAMVRTSLGSAQEFLGSAEPFPPRREVGRFLAASWDALVAELPEHLSVQVESTRVAELARSGDQWVINGQCFEEVLLATGHQHAWAGQLDANHPYFDGLDAVAPGAEISVRGAALTFIDVCLALSEGRGGRFEGEGLLRYVAGGEEPARIQPVSRSGRFMEVKPNPGAALAGVVLDNAEEFEARIAWAQDVEDLRRVLIDAARSLLHTAEEQTLRAVLDGTDFSGDATAELRTSCEVALGLREPGAPWALGHAWRTLYQALIRRVSYGAPIPGFADLARTMERVAFGPPPVTATRLLALIDAGIVAAPIPEEAKGADVDAVIAPAGVLPGSLAAHCIEHGWLGRLKDGRLDLGRAGQSMEQPTLAVIGRDAEGMVLGHDTLNRELHPELRNWANAVVARAFDRKMTATVPLEARLEPWMLQLAADPQRCAEIVDTFGSPTNVVQPGVLDRNAQGLIRAGQQRGVEVRVFFARKANKALGFVDAARDHGHGIDVASERELQQVLDRGVPGERIILSAAIKPDRLLRLAIANSVCISADSRAEARRIEHLAQGQPVRIAPRIAPDPSVLPATRFGELASQWVEEIERGFAPNVHFAGVHVHLHGYAERDRRKALAFAFQVIDAAPGQPEFIDIGGGIPMSYLERPEQWRVFHERLRTPDFTWKGDPLANVYPFFQRPVRGEWLAQLFDAPVPGFGRTSDEFRARNLRLHAEPGRSLLDGGGMILARVAFVKQRSDGLPLVGLEMNRTQCRTTSDDILLDPLLVPAAEGPREHEGIEAFLVGAYCIEDEVIIRRAMRFPKGVVPGDVIAIPNTAGYFMHILESASHQIPLAKNVVFEPRTAAVHLDAIDED
ncbi:FAD/NAD(P)-binding protein [Corynebacterium gerontici]|uniref:Diaminopimelate decarboxylase n=1 Tax=Corynebacterium gerontici TaxID=2079234 RepID=A0A3G6J1F7_9CORY|nr:FAD/NAD(P)-binding protein [Corynebacterium gerontici]AZA11861.1 Diaminopimelate decarboxylase [Corynebacterium gerontici]